jgi:hypothetical protein
MPNNATTPAASAGLQGELRSTLAALEELGPAYEPELAASLSERLRRFRPPPVPSHRPANPMRGLTLALPLAIAVAFAGAALTSVAAHTHPAGWRYDMHRQWRAVPVNPGTGPNPLLPPARSVQPGTF